MRLEVKPTWTSSEKKTAPDRLRNIGGRYSTAASPPLPPRVSPVEGTEPGASSCWVYDPNHMVPYQTCAVVNQTDVGHGSGACPNRRAAVSNGTASVSHTGNRSHHRFGTSGTENLQGEPIRDAPGSVGD